MALERLEARAQADSCSVEGSTGGGVDRGACEPAQVSKRAKVSEAERIVQLARSITSRLAKIEREQRSLMATMAGLEATMLLQGERISRLAYVLEAHEKQLSEEDYMLTLVTATASLRTRQ
jgi:hypothetical protein